MRGREESARVMASIRGNAVWPCGLSLARLPIFLMTLMFLSPGYAVTFSDYPELEVFAAGMVENHGFTTQEIQRAFRCARLRPEIIEAMERPAEALPWYEYRKIFLTEENVQRGVRFWKKNAPAFERAREQHGVAPEIIAAILGVETQYGKNKGNYPVLDALATLMLDYPSRAAFFRGQTEEFLLLARELKVNPCHFKGSYAGAMGIPQFIPSSYRRYAVDFDGDGKRDILGSPEDAIGSVANYLKHSGWETNAPVVDDVRVEGTLYFWVERLGIKPALSIRHLVQYGIYPPARKEHDRRAALIELEGETGPFFRLGYNNFYAITRYNHSTLYAMAVYELGELMRQRREAETP